jgi:prepilin-type N-terminal cleavage/methylation domain-containing protein
MLAHNMFHLQTNKGLTLIEMLLSLAIIGIIAGFSVPVYQSFMVRNDLDIAVGTVAQTLRRAQMESEAMRGDSTWGVHIGSGAITLFRGGAYATRDTDYDEDNAFPSTISSSGISEIVFDRLTGDPQAVGTITLSSTNGDARTLTINEKGTISY